MRVCLKLRVDWFINYRSFINTKARSSLIFKSKGSQLFKERTDGDVHLITANTNNKISFKSKLNVVSFCLNLISLKNSSNLKVVDLVQHCKRALRLKRFCDKVFCVYHRVCDEETAGKIEHCTRLPSKRAHEVSLTTYYNK